jgi:curved DNA-binding protein CbpA
LLAPFLLDVLLDVVCAVQAPAAFKDLYSTRSDLLTRWDLDFFNDLMTEDESDLYRVLGVPPDASHAEIVHAYRRQIRAVHPDARPSDPDASARFRALAQAYEVLSDPARRDAYDKQRPKRARPAPAPSRRPAPPRRYPRGRTAWPPPGVPLWAGPVYVQPDEDQAP